MMSKNILITTILFHKYNFDFKELYHISSKGIQGSQIPRENIVAFLKSCCHSAKHTIYRSTEQKQFMIVPMVVMVAGCDELKDKKMLFWESLTKKNDKLREDFIETIDVIYHLLAIIAESSAHFASLKQEKEKKSEEEQEKWFKEFLYERNAVERSELQRMRRKGELNFQNAGKILSQYCHYNEDKFTFEYTYHQEQHPNFFMKFRLRSRRGNFTNIPEAVFEYQETPLKMEYSFCLETVLSFLFSTAEMEKTYCREWEVKCEGEVKKNASIERLWKSYDLGYFYPLLVVCANTLYPSEWSKTKIKQLRERDIETLKKYTKKVEKIDVLLGANAAEKEQAQEEKREGEKEGEGEGEVMRPLNPPVPTPRREETEANSEKIKLKFTEKRQRKYD